MKEKSQIVPPLVTILLGVGVCSMVQPLFVSDEAMTAVVRGQVTGTMETAERIFERLAGEEAGREFREVLEAEQAEDDIEELIAETTSPEMLTIRRIVNAIGMPINVLIWLGLGVLTLTMYFNVAGNLSVKHGTWSDWLGFTLWSMLPVTLYYLLFFVATLFTGEAFPKQYLAPLAWLPPLQNNAFAINLTFGMIWVIWIQTVGLRRWTDRSIHYCLTIVLIPWFSQWLIASGVAEAVKAI